MHKSHFRDSETYFCNFIAISLLIIKFLDKTCNYCQKTDCYIDGNCLSECLIYKASVSRTTDKFYYGTCENALKEPYNNHKCSFRNKSCEKNTEFSLRYAY